MKLLSLSWTHKASAAPAREALAAVPVEKVLSVLRERGCEEAAAVSTCNRFELYAAGRPDAVRSADWFLDILSELASFPVASEAEIREDIDAVLHLFSVSSGLDSLVVGETEILGQTKTGYEAAKALGMTDKRLNVLFQRALYVGKKVRSETAVASGASSVPSVAVQLAESIFGCLGGKSALILGAGAMAELAAKHLAARGVGRLTVANRTWERAYALAARCHGEAVPWADFPAQLAEADVVIASTGAPQAVVTREMVVAASRKRFGRSIFFIDIAMPRDIEESVHQLDGVYLYRLEDFEAIVAKNMAGRAESVAAARAIIESKAAEFDRWAKSLSLEKELSLRHSDLRAR
ncbi:MAG: glutamyl-tRNA reductase [Elusimicrobia bacterium RBG_16_66_12]|nr:MAG: glutamyl-tRNA reductase [Elusimicrobia bacterium RBG_16_66_12]